MIELKGDALKLLGSLDMGYMGGIAYDTSWLARIPLHTSTNKPMLPQALLWLFFNQREDGSWGAEVEYCHDRVLSTLSSIITLKKSAHPEKFADNIKKGEAYIWYNIKNLRGGQSETVAFELLFPALMNEAEDLSFNLPFHEKTYSEEREKKLLLGYSDILSKRPSTINYSIEHLGENFQIRDVGTIQNRNGSIGNSPAATAFILTKGYDQWAYNYVMKVLKFNQDSSMSLYPFEIFEKAWVLDNLMLSEMPFKGEIKGIIDYLKDNWTDDGISMSRTYESKDLDDTAVVFKLLRSAGVKLDPAVFNRYFAKDHFKCYFSERNPSMVVQIRVLDAIKSQKDFENRDEYIDKILGFLRSNGHSDGYFKDKWHISPYYTTSLGLRAFGDLDSELSARALNWMTRTQNENGSWGVRNGTAEETAYALQGLIHYHTHVENIDTGLLQAGIRFLVENYHKNNYPELWIGKGLYSPVNVARSAVISALYMYNDKIQPLPA